MKDFINLEIIKAHQGRILAESKGTGKGSSFFIEFPMKFITPQEKQKMEREEKQREQNVEGFVKGI